LVYSRIRVKSLVHPRRLKKKVNCTQRVRNPYHRTEGLMWNIRVSERRMKKRKLGASDPEGGKKLFFCWEVRAQAATFYRLQKGKTERGKSQLKARKKKEGNPILHPTGGGGSSSADIREERRRRLYCYHRRQRKFFVIVQRTYTGPGGLTSPA